MSLLRGGMLACGLGLLLACQPREPASASPPKPAPEAAIEAGRPLAPLKAAAPAKPLQYQSWDAEEDGDPKSYRIGDLTLTFSSGKGEEDTRWPVMTLKDEAGRSATVRGVEWSRAAAEFGAFRLDRGHAEPQVLFSSYTGGAHCCVSLIVLTRGADAWKASEIGDYDAGWTLFPQDADGDGHLELVGGDGGFDYLFASHAGSWFPPVVYELREGKLTDVSADPRYRPLFAAFIPEAKAACGERENGACAAYVAAAMRAGEGEAAWAYMLAHHQPVGDWLPSFCKAPEVEGKCPEGQELPFKTFPPALAHYLKEAGYGAPKAAARAR